jgi:hypothetical protein
MDVQTNIGHVVKMFAGYKPYNLADFEFRIIFCHICKSIMIDLFVFRQLCYIVQCSPFGISKVGTCTILTQCVEFSFIHRCLDRDKVFHIDAEKTDIDLCYVCTDEGDNFLW